MVYSYTPLLYEGAVKRLPFLGVQLFSDSKETDIVSSLVDSGSDHSVFSLQLLEELGLEKGKPVTFGGFGSKDLPGWVTQVNFRIDYNNTPIEWTTETIFSAAADRSVLGQHGFFEYFKVTFNRKRLEFEIEPQF